MDESIRAIPRQTNIGHVYDILQQALFIGRFIDFQWRVNLMAQSTTKFTIIFIVLGCIRPSTCCTVRSEWARADWKNRDSRNENYDTLHAFSNLSCNLNFRVAINKYGSNNNNMRCISTLCVCVCVCSNISIYVPNVKRVEPQWTFS